MKILIINKSDSIGGAAIVSRRLMEALRDAGADARMLVCEKFTDSPFITAAAKPALIKRKFFWERFKIFIANGLNRKTLFKIDTGEIGLPLWRHPMVKHADAILLNWVNQGMLSLKGVDKILKLGKPVIWTMHDLWCFTGLCHHPGKCNRFQDSCGECPLLGLKARPEDLSHKTWKRKFKLYDKSSSRNLTFVAVSNWLRQKAAESSLLKDKKVEVIPNAFKINESGLRIREEGALVRILFGAARLDDPIKGLTTLKIASEILAKQYPSIAQQLEIAVFGSVRDSASLEGFDLPLVNLGILKGEQAIAKAYLDSDIVVSASAYETLPGTLVEAQAYGCIPVCFKRGGQPDIIDQLSSGYMADYDSDTHKRAQNLVQGIIWAYSIVRDSDKHRLMVERMKQQVENKFSYRRIAQSYISLINGKISNK